MRLRGLFLTVVVLLFPFAAPAQTRVFDLTPAFIDCGADIEELLVYRVGGIVLIRGTTSDATKAADAGRIATFLGYERVANLIRVTDGAADDALIEARGHRQLDLEPMLDGCRLSVDSSLGIVQVGGKVKREAQKTLAIEILLRVTGVKEVHWNQR
jgi:osmotically-inducible protein OsmY